MIVKLIAPGIIPGDYVTVELQGIPDRGHTICLYTGEDDEQLLTVKSVVWPMQLVPGMRHHATQADMPEVLLDRAEDVGDSQPFNIADTCCGQCVGGTCYVDAVTGA